MLNTTLRCKSRSSIAAATIGSSKIFPHEPGTGTRSWGPFWPCSRAFLARAGIRDFQADSGHC